MDKAYEALRDAEYALRLLEQCEDDKRQFRILFVACLTLLKTVGQVLVYKTADPDTKKAALELFDEHKADKDKHDIYFKFIERERGFIIHEYSVNLPEHDYPLVVETEDDAYLFELGDLYRPLAEDEHFNNEDVRDLIQQAIDWWKTQLSVLQNKLT
jgi:hypothetical protein